MRVKVRLDTMSDINKFIDKLSSVEDIVSLEDNIGHIVSAKSLLGALYTMEWEEVYCTCIRDISSLIREFII